MGAEKTPSILDIYRAGRELGHGRIPGNMTDEQICSRYSLIIQTLKNTFEGTREEYLRFITHMTYIFNFLEFEGAWKMLQKFHTIDDIIKMPQKEMMQKFRQYSQKHPEEIFEGGLREHCIHAMVNARIVKKEWYSIA